MEWFAWHPWLLGLRAWIYGPASATIGGSATWMLEILVLALAAYVLRALRRRGLGLKELRFATLVLGLLAAGLFAGALPAARALSFLSLLFLWWRGLIAAQYHVRHDVLTEQFSHLVLGQLAIVALTSALGGMPRGPGMQAAARAALTGALSTSIIGLFVVGLLTLAVSRLLTVRQDEEFDQPQEAGSRWRPAVLALVAVLALALLWAVRAMAGPAFPALQAALAAFLARALGLIERLIEPVALLVGRLIEPVIRFLASILHPFVIQPGPAAEGPAKAAQEAGGHLPVAVYYALRLLGLVAAAVVVTFVFLRSVWSAFGLVEAEVPEEREALSRLEVKSNGGKGATRRRRRAPEPALTFIRKAYRRFQSVAGTRGLVRAESETPREFLARLQGAAAVGPEAAAALTQLYMQGRYGSRPLTAEEEAEARRLLGDIEKAAGSRRPNTN